MKLLPLIKSTSGFKIPPLPDKWIWTSSSVRLFRRCKRRFFWKYIARLSSSRPLSSLMIGLAFHTALAEWYSGKRTNMAVIAARYSKELHDNSIQNRDLFSEDDWEKLATVVETFVGMLLGYEKVYGHDKSEWVIKRTFVEKTVEADFGEFIFMGKTDLIAANKKSQTAVFDHKTTSKMEDSYIQRLPLDTQMRAYVSLIKRGLGLKVNLVVYDIVQKCKLRRKTDEPLPVFHARVRDDYASRPNFYFHREELLYSQADIEAFEFELRQTHKEFTRLISENDYKDPRTWGINCNDCTVFFRLCEFHPACTTGLDKGTSLNYVQRSDLNPEIDMTGEH